MSDVPEVIYLPGAVEMHTTLEENRCTEREMPGCIVSAGEYINETRM